MDIMNEEYDIKTSYFKLAADLGNSVSVCANTPPWYGKARAHELICDKKLYNNFFKRYQMTEEDFRKEYRKMLDKLDPYEILKKYNNKILLGWYAKPKFDSRFVIVDWIYETTGIEIHEITKEDMEIYVI